MSYAQEEYYESLATFLNNVKSCRYRFSSSEGNPAEIGLRVLGEETIGRESTWKVEIEAEEEGETTNIATLWISKSTGKCLQAKVDGEIYTGGMAELMGSSLLLLWAAWVGTWQESWDLPTFYGWVELGWGRAGFLGSETKTFGSTSLMVYKFAWEAYPNAPQNAPEGYAEIWFAPVSFGTLLAYLYTGSSDRTEWVKIELLSIELASPQSLPRIVVDASIDRERLKPGEEVTVSITVSNTGGAMGAHNLTLTVNGEVRKSWLIVINSSESKSLSYSLSFPEEGVYSVRVGDRTFTITVSAVPPAKFEVIGLSINPNSIKVGKSSTISVSIKNSGGQSGTYEVRLKINNQVVDTKTVTLGVGQSTTVSFSYKPEKEGTYTIDVEGLTGSLTVIKEAAFQEMLLILIMGVIAIIVIVITVFLVLRRKPKPVTTAHTTLPPPPPP